MKHENLPINAQVLMEARRMVAQGWIKGMSSAGEGDKERVCLSHALWAASRQNGVDPIAIASVVARIIGTSQIPSWNDCWSRTHKEVLAALDEAIMRETGARGPYEIIDDHFFNELEKIGG